MNRSASWRGTNGARVAGFNFAVLIDTIRRSPAGLSRIELATATGLSAQTITNIARRAIELGLLVEGERAPSHGLGKPRTPLLLNPTGFYAVGVHLDPAGITYVVVDLAGGVVARHACDLDLTAAPVTVLQEIAGQIDTLIAGNEIPSDKIAGIGFASPGPVDLARGMIVSPPHLPTWRDVPVTEELGRLTSYRVILDKDVAAAAVGERWAGVTMDAADSVYLYMSAGVGTGIVAGGGVLRGTTGNAGDVGHIPVAPDGFLCPCGMRGCLAGELSDVGILTAAMAAGALPQTETTRENTGPLLSALLHCYEAGSPPAVATIERAARTLSVAVRTIANVTDAEIVAIGGPTWARLSRTIEPLLGPLLAPGLARGDLVELKVLSSALGEDAAAIGTACLVLDDAFMPSTGVLVL